MEENAKKVTISMKPELLEFVDAYSKRMNISRSATISVLVNYGVQVIREIVDSERQRKEELFEYIREKDGYEDYSLLQ